MTRMGVEYVIRDAFTRAKAYQKAWKDYEKDKASGRPAAAARPSARTARRDPRRQAARARPLLPRRRDPHAHPARRRDGLQDRHVPARARRLQGRQGDRRARRRRLDLLRLVGVQGRSHRRHPAQRRDHDEEGRPRLNQLRQRRARAPPQHGSRKDDEVGRHDGGRSVRDGDNQSRRSSCVSTAASVRSKSARMRTSSSGTIIR